MPKKPLAIAALLFGCHGSASHTVRTYRPEAQSNNELVRAGWTAAVEPYLAELRACTRGAESPKRIVHVESLAQSRAVGVTWVDGLGVTEHCTARGSKVVLRRRADVPEAALLALPMLTLGSERPSVPLGTVVEEVLSDGRTVGWLHWLPRKERR